MNESSDLFVRQCKNVSLEESFVAKFVTRYYLTTWNSAFIEGAKAGLALTQRDPKGALTILHSMPPEATFCANFDHPFKEVSLVAESIFRNLNLQMEKSNKKSGEFETEYIFREHEPVGRSLFLAKWKEKYLVYVSENIEYGVDVRIYRDILISRRSKDYESGWSPYIEATSNGRNETWILLQFDSKLSAGN